MLWPKAKPVINGHGECAEDAGRALAEEVATAQRRTSQLTIEISNSLTRINEFMRQHPQPTKEPSS